MAAYPPMTVTFDDGTSIRLEPRPKDLARAELSGFDFQTGGPIVAAYAVAYATLGRLSRSGVLDDKISLPDSLDAFVDVADVDEIENEDPDAEGEG